VRTRTSDTGDTLTGKTESAPSVRFTKYTDRVPAALDVLFGFRFEIIGVTEQGQRRLRY
jgi:hypothetical protein